MKKGSKAAKAVGVVGFDHYTERMQLDDLVESRTNGSLVPHPCQRKDNIWNTEKVAFVDTLRRNIPCPKLFIGRNVKDSPRLLKGKDLIIDGLQRLTVSQEAISDDGQSRYNLVDSERRIIKKYKYDVTYIVGATMDELYQLFLKYQNGKVVILSEIFNAICVVNGDLFDFVETLFQTKTIQLCGVTDTRYSKKMLIGKLMRNSHWNHSISQNKDAILGTGKSVLIDWAKNLKVKPEYLKETMSVLDDMYSVLDSTGISTITSQNVFEAIFLAFQDIKFINGGISKVPYIKNNASEFLAGMSDRHSKLYSAWATKSKNSIDGGAGIKVRKNIAYQYIAYGKVYDPIIPRLAA